MNAAGSPWNTSSAPNPRWLLHRLKRVAAALLRRTSAPLGVNPGIRNSLLLRPSVRGWSIECIGTLRRLFWFFAWRTAKQSCSMSAPRMLQISTVRMPLYMPISTSG
jgi:hypothetical protein